VKALQESAYIKHFQYGLGVVSESDAEHASIDFELHGVKKLIASIMVVEPAEGTLRNDLGGGKSPRAPQSRRLRNEP
jgi:hypothetical protein